MDKICGQCKHFDAIHKMCSIPPKFDGQEVTSFMAVGFDDLACHKWAGIQTRLDYFMGRGKKKHG